MANWDKLDAELDSVLQNMTESDWLKWDENRPLKRAMRKIEMKVKANFKREQLLKK